MRQRLIAVIAVAGLLLGCRSKTEFGRCIGLNQEPVDSLRYEASTRNIVLAIVGVELIYPPVKVVLDQYKCPVALKRPTP